MSEFLAIFLTWQFIILSVSIYAVIHIVRIIFEYFILNNPKLPGSPNSRVWRDLILPLLPIAIGIGFVFVAKSFPYPAILTETYSKVLFSTVAGLLSSTIFRVIKTLLNNGGSNNGPSPYSPSPYIQPYVQPVPLFPPSNTGQQPAPLFPPSNATPQPAPNSTQPAISQALSTAPVATSPTPNVADVTASVIAHKA